MDFVVCDFDGEHPDISTTSSLQKRINVCQKLAPFLEGLEAVAFLSSSAFFENTKEPNRINTHIVVWFDRPYPRATVRAFYRNSRKTENGEKYLDPALSVKTQPHIVATIPYLKGQSASFHKGNGCFTFQGVGSALTILTFQPKRHRRTNNEAKSDLKLSTNSEEKAAQLLRLAETGS